MKTILAVDDFPDMLREYGYSLRKAYNMLTADNPVQALKIIEERPIGSIDLLLTDLNMPVMKGHQLIKETYKLRPQTRFILASGEDESAVKPYLEQLKREGVPDVKYFDKSHSSDELVRLVESAIGK